MATIEQWEKKTYLVHVSISKGVHAHTISMRGWGNFRRLNFRVYIIIRRKYFACLIFVVEGDRGKIFTAKISRSTVMQVYTHTHTQHHHLLQEMLKYF